MITAIGLPGATEFAVILILAALVGGILLTTFLIARSRKQSDDQPLRHEEK
jgi:hypothetical protein